MQTCCRTVGVKLHHFSRPMPCPFPDIPGTLSPNPSHPPSAITISLAPMNAPPQSNFQSIFNNALLEYKKQTREDLFMQPLATKLQACDSPHAILSLLQEQTTDRRLTNWLSPVVNVIYALSSSLGEDAGLVRVNDYSFSGVIYLLILKVLSPAKLIFVAIGVLLSVRGFLSFCAWANVTPKSFRRLKR